MLRFRYPNNTTYKCSFNFRTRNKLYILLLHIYLHIDFELVTEWRTTLNVMWQLILYTFHGPRPRPSRYAWSWSAPFLLVLSCRCTVQLSAFSFLAVVSSRSMHNWCPHPNECRRKPIQYHRIAMAVNILCSTSDNIIQSAHVPQVVSLRVAQFGTRKTLLKPYVSCNNR